MTIADMIRDLAAQLGMLKRQVSQIESRDEAPQALYLVDGATAPATASGLASIYVDTSDGDLKIKFADGTVKTIATDT